jgi:hypothetical protein
MTDIEKARKLFHDSGLAFPTVPEELAVRVKELDDAPVYEGQHQ